MFVTTYNLAILTDVMKHVNIGIKYKTKPNMPCSHKIFK